MKKKIAIISILKPVNDPRNYEKIGISLAETNKYEINIIGFSSKNITAYPNINFHPLFHFKRLSWSRLLAPWKSYKLLVKLKPDLVIVNTHELLEVIVFHKIIFGSKILYDIQENYFQNILHTRAFPLVVKQVLAAYVRVREWIAAPFFDYFFLAEKCYVQELSFIGNKNIVVENKAQPTPTRRFKNYSPNLRLVYTGTIAEEYGVFDAISFASKLRNHFPDLVLTLIGYCPNKKTLRQLMTTIEGSPSIRLIGGNEIVPHDKIMEELSTSDFALLPYRLNTYYSSRIPTKLYESISLKKPAMVRRNPSWQHLFSEFDGFIFTDFNTVDSALISDMKQPKFFTKGDIKKNASWETEKEKVVATIEKILG